MDYLVWKDSSDQIYFECNSYLLNVSFENCKSFNYSASIYSKIFLWNANRGNKEKIPLLTWEKVYLLKDLGVLGIQDLYKQNQALGKKLVWKLYKEPNSSRVALMFNKYLERGTRESIFTASSLLKGSSI